MVKLCNPLTFQPELSGIRGSMLGRPPSLDGKESRAD